MIEFNKDNFLIIDDSSQSKFVKIYNKLFNDLWYPNFFINSNYSMLIIKRNKIYPSQIPELKGKDLLEIKNKNLLESIEFKNFWSLDFDKFFKKIVKIFNDEKVYVKSINYQHEEPNQIYDLRDDSFDNVLSYIGFDKILKDFLFQSADDGVLLFGNNGEWGYYFGEFLLNYDNFDEFDLFIIKKGKEDILLSLLEECIKVPFIIEEINLETVFQIDSSMITDYRISEIKLNNT